ncbi:unnamed protein product [Urochloa humidicola]
MRRQPPPPIGSRRGRRRRRRPPPASWSPTPRSLEMAPPIPRRRRHLHLELQVQEPLSPHLYRSPHSSALSREDTRCRSQPFPSISPPPNARQATSCFQDRAPLVLLGRRRQRDPKAVRKVASLASATTGRRQARLTLAASPARSAGRFHY